MKKRGFTLIELVIVIAILGILAGIAIPRLMDSQASARGAKIIAELRTIDSAATVYSVKTGALPTSLDQLTTDDPGAVPPKLNLMAINPEPNGEDFIVTKTSGKEERYAVAAGTNYVIANGRATYDGNYKTVEWYLWDNSYSALVEEIRQWQQGKTYTGTDPYFKEAYKEFTNSGLIKKLSVAQLAALVGEEYNFADGSYRWQAPENKGNLFLRSATAVMMDGTLGDIQMLVPNPADPNNFGAYAAAGFIVEGEVYLNLYKDNVVRSDMYFGNGSVYLPLNNGGSVRIANAVQAIQYLNRSDVSNNWNSPAEQIAWFKNALVQAGYTKTN